MIQHPRSQFDDSEEEQGGRSREEESTRRFDDDRALDFNISPTHTITPTEFSDIALRPQHISPKQWNVAFVLSHSYIVFYLSMINIELPNSLAMSPPYSCN
ncbi:unnamed protein product [Brassica napus]|uniref:(rape) hypothetical protein n=1 Tax=Brassica napus TaxID=3708 RepID=A0A816XVU0_BRANA|nr:unnamed protein product [Brassica napus]